MIAGKFGVAGMPNAQRVLVAGGSGQVSSLHAKAGPAQPAQEYVDPISSKKDGAAASHLNAVIVND